MTTNSQTEMPFDEIAIEAAAKALDECLREELKWVGREATNAVAQAALTAAWASLQSRGMTRNGEGYQSAQGIWYANSHMMIDTEDTFPVFIVRLPALAPQQDGD